MNKHGNGISKIKIPRVDKIGVVWRPQGVHAEDVCPDTISGAPLNCAKKVPKRSKILTDFDAQDTIIGRNRRADTFERIAAGVILPLLHLSKIFQRVHIERAPHEFLDVISTSGLEKAKNRGSVHKNHAIGNGVL